MRHNALRALIVSAAGLVGATAATGAVGAPTTHGATSDSPADINWSAGPVDYVYSSPDGSIAGNAYVSSFALGEGKPAVMFSWQSNADVGQAKPTNHVKRSTNGGETFPTSFVDTDSPFYATTRIGDGSLIDIGFIPCTADVADQGSCPTAPSTDKHYATLRAKRSTNNGATWTPFTAVLHNPDFTFSLMSQGGLRVNPNILTGPDGALYLSYYTRYSGDPGYRAEVAKSIDNGANWTRIGAIRTPTTATHYNEVGLSWTPDGRMMAVVTEDAVVPAGSGRRTIQLITARSDDGATWGEYETTPITMDPGEAYRPRPTGVGYGVTPDLELLPNGAMALRWGRPDNWFAISGDGGKTFVHARRTYVNYPVGGYYSHGSSGNGSMAVTGPDTVVISGDNCAPTWGCPATDSNFVIDGTYKVWRRIITITP